MKWLSGSLIFFNATTVCALVIGMMANGLSRGVAIFSVLVGLVVGFIAYRSTAAIPLWERKPKSVWTPPESKSKRQQRREERARKGLPKEPEAPRWRYRNVWFWILAACFAIFVVRSFCWLI